MNFAYVSGPSRAIFTGKNVGETGMNDFHYICSIAMGRIFAFDCNVGRALAEVAGGAVEVFRAKGKRLREWMPRGERFIQQITDGSILEWAAAEWEWARRYGIKVLCCYAPEYPRRLRECPDAPFVLYCKGEADLDAAEILAVVGTRRCSWYGKTITHDIVASMAGGEGGGTVIVSGLAYGIDEAAHRAAIAAGLRTVAVLPCGLDTIYPAGHRRLATEILDSGGALVTDFARCHSPVAIQFLRRNRIIAGLSDATLLGESYAKGGGLITCRLADSYGRAVFAVPGRLSDASFEGCHNLIERNVAHIATGAGSIVKEMGWRRPKRGAGAELPFGSPAPPAPEDDLSRAILRFLGDGGMHPAEDIAGAAGTDIGTAAAKLVEMELCGQVRSGAGNRYAAL